MKTLSDHTMIILLKWTRNVYCDPKLTGYYSVSAQHGLLYSAQTYICVSSVTISLFPDLKVNFQVRETHKVSILKPVYPKQQFA